MRCTALLPDTQAELYKYCAADLVASLMPPTPFKSHEDFGRERVHSKNNKTCSNGQGGMLAFFCIRFVFFKQIRSTHIAFVVQFSDFSSLLGPFLALGGPLGVPMGREECPLFLHTRCIFQAILH